MTAGDPTRPAAARDAAPVMPGGRDVGRVPTSNVA
jgi:hypothetical protein